MDNINSCCVKKNKWSKFPLVPFFEYEKSDGFNTSRFTFKWLCFQLWSRDSFDFEIAFGISEHWGIGFTALLPYLRIVFCIPCPDRIRSWWYKNLSRKPKKSRLKYL